MTNKNEWKKIHFRKWTATSPAMADRSRFDGFDELLLIIMQHMWRRRVKKTISFILDEKKKMLIYLFDSLHVGCIVRTKSEINKMREEGRRRWRNATIFHENGKRFYFN